MHWVCNRFRMTSGSRFSRATDSGRETLKETDITLPIRLAAPAIAFGLAIVLAAACDTPPPSSSIDDDDIGGVVASGSGPEAGVWVIAETDDLDTRFARIVVTDDKGRFVVPDLPEASYQLWARGHGLVDSIPVAASRGDHVDLTAIQAPDAAAAASLGL